jgi:hypothetical protein
MLTREVFPDRSLTVSVPMRDDNVGLIDSMQVRPQTRVMETTTAK